MPSFRDLHKVKPEPVITTAEGLPPAPGSLAEITHNIVREVDRFDPRLNVIGIREAERGSFGQGKVVIEISYPEAVNLGSTVSSLPALLRRSLPITVETEVLFVPV